jgi:hypothetical protein
MLIYALQRMLLKAVSPNEACYYHYYYYYYYLIDCPINRA